VDKIDTYTVDLNLWSSIMTNAFKPMTKDDVAEVLGLSLRTVENWVNEGTLPSPTKLGNRVYWHPGVFYSWLERCLTVAHAQDEMVPQGCTVTLTGEQARKSKSATKSPKTELEKFRARDRAKLDAMLS
jgi:excisionase family DNA binding protein